MSNKLFTFNELPPGWRFRETPGHGYLVPSAAANRNVPEKIRQKEYEEDCAYVIPVHFNGGLFTPETLIKAEQTFKDWHPTEFELCFRVLQRGESYLKDKNFYARLDHLGQWEKGAGFGDWCFDIPKGFVYRFANRVILDGCKADRIQPPSREEISFLISDEDDHGKEFYTDADITMPYKRDETYYTWSDYEHKTGLKRFK